MGFAAPGWTGGSGARYLTLAGFACGVLDCVPGEGAFAAGGVPEGIGGAGDLTDFGLGVRGLGLGGSAETKGVRGAGVGCG